MNNIAIDAAAPAAERRQHLLATIWRVGGVWTRQRAWELYDPRPDAKFVRRDLQALCTDGHLVRVKIGEYKLKDSVRDMASPGTDELRAASLSLRVDAALSAVPGMAGAVSGALALKRYHISAQVVGVPRERADEILCTAQGLRAGSTPSTEDFAKATRLLGEATQ
ncbi:hypothetical protein [Kitasatospora sp. NPDC127116]|uniref:hypothetical protein n=1 Tax=Kitasatospora sp. NPDC127116 TaxID=3345367 RepID=UPI003629CBE1